MKEIRERWKKDKKRKNMKYDLKENERREESVFGKVCEERFVRE